jgi:multiple sugar transport system substrate-binding protein
VSRRRLFAGGAAALGGAPVLGACGRGAPSGPAGGGDAAAPGAPRKAPVTVTVWHGANAITDQGQELLRTFEQVHPQIKVDWRSVEWSGAAQMLQRLPIAAASGDLPDTFRGHWSNFGNLIHQRWVRPLDAHMRRAGVGREDFTPSTWALSSYGGQVYAMPSYAYTLAPMWNKDLLRRNGLDAERLPATFEQVLEASARVLRAGEAVEVAGQTTPGPQIANLGWSHRTATPGHLVFLFGAQVYDASRQRVTPDHPGVLEALTWLVQLDKRQGGYQRVEQFFAAAGSANPFATGQLAVTTPQLRAFPDLTRQAPLLELAVTPYPSRTGAAHEVARTSVQAEVLPITRASAHPDETWALLKWLHVDQAAEWGWRTLNTPCLVGALDAFFEQVQARSFGGDRRLVPFLATYKDLSRRGTSSWPTMPTTLEYLNAFTAVWNDVVQEKVNAETAMKELARTQQLELEQALASG